MGVQRMTRRPCALIMSFVMALASPLRAQVTTSGVLQGATSWFLPTEDKAGELFVLEIGRGAVPAVVLHGGPGGDLTYMLPVARGLEANFRFVFYDQRGSLRSRVTPDSISMGKHVADLERLRSALGVERISIVSHSAGTLLAFEYLRAHPDRVANLVLIGALPHKNGRAHYDAEYAGFWRGLSDSAARFHQRDAVGRELKLLDEGIARPGPRDSSLRAQILQVGAEAFRVDRWRQMLPVRVSPDAARRTRETTNFEYNTAPFLARHPFPVTVINGEFDYTVGPRGSPLWKRLATTDAPNVRVVVLPDAGHLVWHDAPEAFQMAFRRALRQ